MKNICVFCSANDLEEKYTQPAKVLAKLMVKNGYDLVWGGSDVGLMKIISSAVKAEGGKIIGVSMELLKKTAHQNADEMIIEPDLSTRKATMLKRSDAMVVLVGGIGTLDEITEVLEFKKHGFHNKPIVILNTEHFYDGLKMQLEKMRDEGFIKKPLEDLLFFAETPEQAIENLIEKLR